MSFFSTYAGIRLATGKRHPGIIWPLLKGSAMLAYVMLAAPFVLLRYVANIHTGPPVAAEQPRPTTHNGYPRRFEDSVADLQEDMR